MPLKDHVVNCFINHILFGHFSIFPQTLSPWSFFGGRKNLKFIILYIKYLDEEFACFIFCKTTTLKMYAFHIIISEVFYVTIVLFLRFLLAHYN